MTTTTHTPQTNDQSEEKRAYHRNYFRTHPDAARRNQERTYERNQRNQQVSVRHAVNKGKAWTDKDIEQLKDLYPNFTQTDVAYILGRTVRSVQKKAKEIGLRKNAVSSTK